MSQCRYFAPVLFGAVIFLPLTSASSLPMTMAQGECITEAEIERVNQFGQEARVARLAGEEARIFVESVEPGIDSTGYDAVAIWKLGGGFVGVIFKEGCGRDRKFLPPEEVNRAMALVQQRRGK